MKEDKIEWILLFDNSDEHFPLFISHYFFRYDRGRLDSYQKPPPTPRARAACDRIIHNHFAEGIRRSESKVSAEALFLSIMSTLKSSSSEMELDRPNIEEYLTESIYDTSHEKLLLYPPILPSSFIFFLFSLLHFFEQLMGFVFVVSVFSKERPS